MQTDDLNKLEEIVAAADADPSERAEAMAELAWSVWATDLPRAEQLSGDALRIAEECGFERAGALAKRNVGLLLFRGVNLEESMGHLTDALHWFESNDHKRGEADVRLGLAYLFWNFGEFKKGLDEGLKALALYEKAGELTGQGWALSALGGFYHDWNDHGQSREYYERSIGFFEKTGHQVGIGRALNGIGNALSLSGRHDEALEYQDKSLAAHESVSNDFAAAKTLNDIGLILQRQDKHDEALAYHRRSLEIRQKRSYPPGEVTCLLDIGNVHIVKREYDEARDALNNALVLAEQIRSKPKICRAHELLSNLYRDLTQFDTALVHFENFHRIREEVYHEDTETQLNNVRTAYQIEAAEREAEIYRLKNVELKSKNDELEETLAKLQNAQAQLVQTGKMAALGNLVAGLTHEVSTPIGAIKSATDVSRRVIQRFGDFADGNAGGAVVDGAELKKLVEVLRVTSDNSATGTDRVEKILRSLQSFSRLDETEFQKADIHEGLESTLTLIESEVPAGAEIAREYGKVPACYMYPGELNQVFMNLLLNAIGAVGVGGVVKIKTWASKGSINIAISDNGKGIPEEQLETLFDPGFTTRKSRVRMRTGLYTSYNIVQKHHGEIRVDSEPGKGTTFTITFPDRLEKRVIG
jgi:signal transduction histidine kinase